MRWTYLGGGSWELQGGPYLGCMYGDKMDPTEAHRVRLERWDGHQQRWVTHGEERTVVGFSASQRALVEMYESTLRCDLARLARVEP
jgi:hypothetical protein